MENKTIVNINVNNLYPHPNNPRKELGSLEELADSIQKNGVMQNLTVIPLSALTDEADQQPDPDNISLLSDFCVLIGHRRLSAAKLAGVTELPCKIISKISLKEQLGIMLEENMQRNDLTVYEQAQGFQMMLDLGETEDSIAEKTGFSKTTIRRRLNIAKLDQTILQEKEQQTGFQMTLTDLYELEKIADIETRNKILSEATDSKNLAFRAQRAVEAAEKKSKEKAIIDLLFKKGVRIAPDSYAKEMYSSKWKILKEISFNEEVPKDIKLPKQDEPIYFSPYWNGIRVITKQKQEKKAKTPEQLERDRIERNKRTIKDIVKKIDATRHSFLCDILSGKIPALSAQAISEVKDSIWQIFIQYGASVYPSTLRSFFADKEEYRLTTEERETIQKQVDQLSVLHQMLIILDHVISREEPFDYYGIYRESYGLKARQVYDIFEKYGWSFEDETEQKIISGTSELYAEKKAPKPEEEPSASVALAA